MLCGANSGAIDPGYFSAPVQITYDRAIMLLEDRPVSRRPSVSVVWKVTIPWLQRSAPVAGKS